MSEERSCKCADETPIKSGLTLKVKEGCATLVHSCGGRLLLDDAVWSAEFSVNLAWSLCDNPGGWHGDWICECDNDAVAVPAREQNNE